MGKEKVTRFICENEGAAIEKKSRAKGRRWQATHTIFSPLWSSQNEKENDPTLQHPTPVLFLVGGCLWGRGGGKALRPRPLPRPHYITRGGEAGCEWKGAGLLQQKGGARNPARLKAKTGLQALSVAIGRCSRGPGGQLGGRTSQ